MHARQPDRIGRREDGAPVSAAGKRSRPADAGEVSSSTEAQYSFDGWLDRRLKGLYRAVLDEPLPPEMLELLRKSKKAGP